MTADGKRKSDSIEDDLFSKQFPMFTKDQIAIMAMKKNSSKLDMSRNLRGMYIELFQLLGLQLPPKNFTISIVVNEDITRRNGQKTRLSYQEKYWRTVLKALGEILSIGEKQVSLQLCSANT